MKHRPVPIGAVFGRWTVVGPGAKRLHWLCRCACGTEKSVYLYSLLDGVSTSCICLHKELLRASLTKHGESHKTVEHQTWKAMRMRCNNPRNTNYERYGGRGIQVCERWASYDNFLADMGRRPDGMSIERVDNSGNYEPSNCRWATTTEQRLNQRPRQRGAHAA